MKLLKFSICLLVVVLVSVVNASKEPSNTMGDMENTTTKCRRCEKLVGWIESEIESNKTAIEVKTFVEKLCGILGPEYADLCTSILDGDLYIILKWLEKKETPLFVCEQLKQCAKQKHF